MTAAQQYRLTRQVPLVRINRFGESLETALAQRYSAADVARIWRLFVSADCPACGIEVCGEELRALAFPPNAEVASAKIGRMRLGDCARRGCNAWHYDVHFWIEETLDWPALLELAEKPASEPEKSAPAPVRPHWLLELKGLGGHYAPRVALVVLLMLALWLTRQVYQGGRIPFFREPEQFTIHHSTARDPSWPKPLDGSDKQY